MISEYMGPHYGNNVILPGAGIYQLTLLVSPPVSARHIEYQNVWLKPHRANVTSTGSHLVTRHEPSGESRVLTRRRFLIGTRRGGRWRGSRRRGPGPGAEPAARRRPAPAPVALGGQPAGLPRRQHAWGGDPDPRPVGNPVAPRFDRLLFFDVAGSPTGARELLEAALRTLERTLPWGPDGLLFTASWGPGYFSGSLRVASPIPAAKGLSDFELPTIDDYDLCLHLACDDQSRLAEIEAALLHGATAARRRRAPRRLERRSSWRETRTGFVGAGPARRPPGRGGIPAGRPVPRARPCSWASSPTCKRTRPARTRSRSRPAPSPSGTTMQVSYMRLRWTAGIRTLSDSERVARMYAPQVTPEQAARFTTDAECDPQPLGQAISRYGVIGHAQTSARARRHGKPMILRRDFNTVDGGQAGLHFVSLQRTIDDFVTTRNGDERHLGAAAKPGDHRHRQQRDQRVHLRAETSQLHRAVPREAFVPSFPSLTVHRVRHLTGRGATTARLCCWCFSPGRRGARGGAGRRRSGQRRARLPAAVRRVRRRVSRYRSR